MTPSTMRAGGKGESIRYALAASGLGPILVAATARGICAIAFDESERKLEDDLARRFPHAILRRADAEMTEFVAGVHRASRRKPPKPRPCPWTSA